MKESPGGLHADFYLETAAMKDKFLILITNVKARFISSKNIKVLYVKSEVLFICKNM